MGDTSSKNQTKPAHRIIAMLNKIHDHFTAAHGTEGEREKQAHFAHKRLVEKLKLSMNTKKGHLHTIQQLKRKISRDAKEIKKKLEELNKLSDDLNFNTYKLNLKDVVTQINDIRKVMEERMLAATKT